MKSPGNRQFGIVAIVDALGAASYTDAEIEAFLQSRENALKLLNSKMEGLLGEINSSQVDIFTFNDAILIVLKRICGSPSRLRKSPVRRMNRRNGAWMCCQHDLRS